MLMSFKVNENRTMIEGDHKVSLSCVSIKPSLSIIVYHTKGRDINNSTQGSFSISNPSRLTEEHHHTSPSITQASDREKSTRGNFSTTNRLNGINKYQKESGNNNRVITT